MLKEVLTRLGGKAIAQRRKEGFGLPLGHWIRTGEADEWLAILQRDDLAIWEHVDPTLPRTWVEMQRKGKADFAQEIWNLVTLATWWQQASVD